MECLAMDNDNYLRIKQEMSKNDKKKNTAEQGRVFTEAEVEQIEQILNKFKEKQSTKEEPASKTWEKVGHIVGIITGVLTVVGTAIGAITNIISMNNQIDALNEKVDVLIAESAEMHSYLYEDGGVKTQLSLINSALNIKVINVTNENTSSAIEGVSIERKDVDYVTSPITGETCIGTDVDGNTYIAEDLVDETVLLTYQEDGREVYFLGQYNENYRWDGYCVTNAYNADGTLYGICESNFDNGTRIDYKTLYSTNDGEWIYTNRVCGETANSGESVRCTIENNTVKNFTSTNVRITDILYADDYVASKNAAVIQYYNGNTVDKLFEDNTGDAYFVKFNEDGTVKTLYVGQFSNGMFNDSTGNAWDIAYAEEYDFYVCNTGNFKNGSAVTPSTEPISVEEIEAIIAGYDFNCELKWKE